MGWAASYITDVTSGKTVKFRPRGFSMTGKVEDNQLCTVSPIDPNKVSKGDIVLCKVGGSEYLHLVKAIRGKEGEREFLIGNNKGKTNGWTRKVYGKCVKVEP